jgi:hypothetical protein
VLSPSPKKSRGGTLPTKPYCILASSTRSAPFRSSG